MVKLLSDKFIPAEHIAMLQIDIEGYEYILLDGVFREIPDNYLPPVIHFEHKVMFDMDKKHPLVNRTSQMIYRCTRFRKAFGHGIGCCYADVTAEIASTMAAASKGCRDDDC